MCENQRERVLVHGDIIDTRLGVWVRAKRRRRGSSSRVVVFTSSLLENMSQKSIVNLLTVEQPCIVINLLINKIYF